MIRQDFEKEGTSDEISAQITGRSTNMMEFSRMLEKMKQSMDHTAEAKDQFTKNPQVKINIMYDKSLRDVGVMVKMNNLMKRMEMIRYLIGDWKTNSNKYSNITDMVHYVQKRLELLDEAKIVYFTKRAEILRQEVNELLQTKSQDADVMK